MEERHAEEKCGEIEGGSSSSSSVRARGSSAGRDLVAKQQRRARFVCFPSYAL